MKLSSWMISTVILACAVVVLIVLWAGASKDRAVLEQRLESVQQIIDLAAEAADERCQFRVESMDQLCGEQLKRKDVALKRCNDRHETYETLRSDRDALVDTYRNLLGYDIDPPDP